MKKTLKYAKSKHNFILNIQNTKKIKLNQHKTTTKNKKRKEHKKKPLCNAVTRCRSKPPMRSQPPNG